jgi:eukaryotic-like serine/threonine-protein kinase
MTDEANSSMTSATLAGLSLSERWRDAAHKQDQLQREIARRSARSSLFEEPHQSVALGRYVVLGRLGQGGMGVVYAAFDPQLDRKVALKVLSAGASGGTRDGHQRLLREAQALAQLTHPNVVSIYDVGSFEVTRTEAADDDTEPSVFIAMELVEGTTLTRWLAQPRAWREVLDVMLQAARGVSAAHAKGLVHRDFKPDNVMVGSDGRVRVMDFGLARTSGSKALETPARPSALTLDITTAGALVGTPAYMAPEQHAGLEADARSDQFAFCVATWEAVYGARPFAGDSLIELATAVLEGRMRDRPRSVNAPAWLRRALERGLASEPPKRWASMDALVSELEQGRVRASRRLLAVIVSGLVGVAVAGFAGRAVLRAEALRACDETAAASSPWNDEVRAQVHDAILASGLAYAPTTAELVTPWLDGFADTWTDARASACRAREVEQSWDADTYERSMWCLEERRMDLEALVGELADPDAQAVRGAVSAAASLPGIATCIDEARLHRLPAPPPRRDELVESVRGELARARAATAAAQASEALARANGALDQARTLGAPRLVAAAHEEVGAALELLGQYPESVLALREAYFVAAGAGEVELAETSATALARVLGTSLDAHDDGETWLRLADIEGARLADPEGLRDAARLTVRGNVRQHAGDNEAARRYHQRAVEIYERVLGEQHPAFARALQGLATTEIALGHYEEARELNERVHAVLEHVLGRDHPDVALVLHNLASTELALGRYAEADQRFAEVATRLEASLGPQHPKLVGVLTNRATAQRSMGQLGEARRLLARALTIAEHSLGPDHTTVAAVLNNIAVVEETGNHWDEALALHERALAIRQRALPSGHGDIARSLANVATAAEETGDVARARALFEQAIPALELALGPDHTDLAQVISNLAIVHGHASEHAKSLVLHERALAIWERALGPEHPDVALALTALGKELFAAGRAEAAIEPLQRARRIRERPPIDATALAETLFALAEALWAANEDRRSAVGYARRAVAEYRTAALSDEDAVTEIERWIAAHERR